MQDTLIAFALLIISIILLSLSGAIIYIGYMFIFRTKKEYIKYGDRYVVRYRDKKTGKFL